MLELWPFTNFHDMNLDWIIKVIKEWNKRLDDFFNNNGIYDYIEGILEEHPEWVTTVTDGSLTLAKFANSLKLLTVNEYLTPEMYGAVGDGVTDDSYAMARAIEAAEEQKRPLQCNNTYRIVNTRFTTTADVIINGEIQFYGNPAGIKLGNENGYTYFNNSKINIRMMDSDGAGLTGLELMNILSSDIEIVQIRGFETDLMLTGNGRGTSYNTIRVGVIRDFAKGVHLNAVGAGWVNQNYFEAGRYWNPDDYHTYATAVGVYVSGEDNYPDANTFDSPSMEHLYTCAHVAQGNRNKFLNVRTEGSTSALISESGRQNVITISTGNTEGYMARPGAIMGPEYDTDTWFSKYKVFDTGNLAGKAASNAQWASADGLYRHATGDHHSAYLANATADAEGLVMSEGSYAGVFVDCYNYPYIRIHTETLARASSVKIGVVCYDANGNRINQAPGCDTETFEPVTVAGMGFQSYVTNRWLPGHATVNLKLPANTSYVYAFVRAGSEQFTLKRFTVYSPYDNTYRRYWAMPRLNNTPTSVGIPGQLVVAGNIDYSRWGWAYTNAGTWKAIYFDNPPTA